MRWRHEKEIYISISWRGHQWPCGEEKRTRSASRYVVQERGAGEEETREKRGVLTYRLGVWGRAAAAAAHSLRRRPPPPPRTAEAAPCVPPLRTPHTLHTDHTHAQRALRRGYLPESEPPGGRATPPCAPPMLFGFRFRVWMPSFFMLRGRFTCNMTCAQHRGHSPTRRHRTPCRLLSSFKQAYLLGEEIIDKRLFISLWIFVTAMIILYQSVAPRFISRD